MKKIKFQLGLWVVELYIEPVNSRLLFTHEDRAVTPREYQIQSPVTQVEVDGETIQINQTSKYYYFTLTDDTIAGDVYDNQDNHLSTIANFNIYEE